MGYIMGHIVFGWLNGRFSQWVTRVRLTHLEWGLLIFGALLPDFDNILDWVLGWNMHRTFTHSIVFLFVTFAFIYIVSCLCMRFNKDMVPRRNAIFTTMGVLSHIVLDMTLRSGVALFWPSIQSVYLFGIEPFRVMGVYNAIQAHPKLMFTGILIDMSIGGAWIGYLFIKKRIQF